MIWLVLGLTLTACVSLDTYTADQYQAMEGQARYATERLQKQAQENQRLREMIAKECMR
jgi:hypothetical protein